MNQAFRSLLRRPLESLLLLLTIAFGTALSGLVLTAAWPGLGSGASDDKNPGVQNHEITVQARDEDYMQFYRTPNAPPVARVGRVGDPKVVIDLADLAKLKAQAPAVKAAYVNDYFTAGDMNKGLEVKMVSSEYFAALGATLVQGSLPNAADYREKRPVIVLTEYAAKKFFPKRQPVGQSQQGFRVIGVIKVPVNNQYEFRSVDHTEFGPYGVVPYGAQVSAGTNDMVMSIRPLSSLKFFPLPGRDAEALGQLGQAVRQRWADRVSVSSNTAQNAELSRRYRRGSLLLALLGLGGLLVATLSVLSLMLSRVLSRQRQLGIAAALGASRARLRGQYLIETLILGVAGSLLGGLAAAALVWSLQRGVTGPLADQVSQRPVALAVTVAGAALLSVLFGLVPAIQASRVRPAEALRA
jgi:MacB-like periplasmic core domain/FtsX-like permease family